MRLMRLTSCYPKYIEKFCITHPNIRDWTYQEQYKALMEDCSGWADFWAVSLGKLGYEVWEPIGNISFMQRRWAIENGICFNETTWMTDIVRAQINKFRPEIIFADDFTLYPYDFLTQIRNCFSDIRLCVGWCGSPFSTMNVFKAYDLILSNIPSLVNSFRTHGAKSEYMMHAFDKRILEKINRQVLKDIDFSFIGSIQKGNKMHNRRAEIVKELILKSGLKVFCDLYKPSLKNRIKNSIFKIKRTKEKTSIDRDKYYDELLLKKACPGVYGIKMFQKLYESKVSLNTHIDLSKEYASNMRLFETTGIGTCTMTEKQNNLSEIFEPDVEVVTYKNTEEAVEKVQYLLAHDSQRKMIELAGQKRTLKDHTFDQRAIQFNELVRKYTNG